MTEYPTSDMVVPVVTTKHLVRTQPPHPEDIKFRCPERHYLQFEFTQNVWHLPEEEFLRVMDMELGFGLRDIRQHLMETYAKGKNND